MATSFRGTRSALPRVDPRYRKARGAVCAIFALGGFVTGSWIVYIPSVQAELGFSHAVLGVLLLMSGAGSLLSMLPVGRLVDRYGSRKIVTVAGGIFGVAMLGPALAPNIITLGIALLVFGMWVGALDVSMNAHGVLVEHGYGRPIFSGMHAMWSIGGLFASLVGSALLTADISRHVGLSCIGLAASAIALGVSTQLLPRSETQAQLAAIADEARPNDRPSQPILRPSAWYILFLGVLTAFAFMSEGGAGDWGPVFLKSVHSAEPAVAAYAFGAFSVSMTIARLLGDRVVARKGALWSIRAGSSLAFLGFLIALLTPTIWTSLVGWAILGLGLSVLVPQLFKAAAVAGPAAESGRNMSKVVGLGYAGLLAGPALIGFLTLFMPLTLALLVFALFPVGILLGSGRIRGLR